MPAGNGNRLLTCIVSLSTRQECAKEKCIDERNAGQIMAFVGSTLSKCGPNKHSAVKQNVSVTLAKSSDLAALKQVNRMHYVPLGERRQHTPPVVLSHKGD